MKIKSVKASGTARRKIVTPTTSPKVQRILAPTDFSGQSLEGVRYAKNLRLKFGSSLVLLHVIEPIPLMAGGESFVLAQSDSEGAAWALKELAKLARREVVDKKQVTSLVRTGKPFHEITTEAGESQVDLIVIADYTGAQRVLLGSTAECVVRHAPCPVLTVRQHNAPGRVRQIPQLKLRKILVPLDFSNLSKAALPWATFLAAQFRAEIVLLNVVEKFAIDYLLGAKLMNHTIVPLMKQSEADLDGIATGLSQSTGVNVSAVVREGRPYKEICAAAKALTADLIVLTTHGYTGLKHVWLGSTSERVVRHALCPVLVVRELKA